MTAGMIHALFIFVLYMASIVLTMLAKLVFNYNRLNGLNFLLSLCFFVLFFFSFKEQYLIKVKTEMNQLENEKPREAEKKKRKKNH